MVDMAEVVDHIETITMEARKVSNNNQAMAMTTLSSIKITMANNSTMATEINNLVVRGSKA
jgi:hypothetical protein